MTGLAYHGPGDRMDAHNADSTAHGGAFLTAGSIAGPEIIAPPGSLFAASAAAAWYTANAATYMRFTVPTTKTYRWANLRVGTQSGNIQVAVGSLSRTGTTVNFTRRMDSGVIACPAAGDQRIDLTATSLTPGEYAIGLWCDNVTAQFLHGLATGFTATRLLFTSTGLTSGIGSGVITVGVTTRWVSGLTLETDS